MLDKQKKSFIKTPAFYYVSHFAKYIKPGSKRIHTNKFSENISVSAFKNPDKSVIIILLNKSVYQKLTFSKTRNIPEIKLSWSFAFPQDE